MTEILNKEFSRTSLLKGGGAIRCLTNPLDVTLGRDLQTR